MADITGKPSIFQYAFCLYQLTENIKNIFKDFSMISIQQNLEAIERGKKCARSLSHVHTCEMMGLVLDAQTSSPIQIICELHRQLSCLPQTQQQGASQ